MKVMALDFGSARTGVAVSDPTGVIARPLCVVERAASRRRARRARAPRRRRASRAGRRRASADACAASAAQQARVTEQFAASLREPPRGSGHPLRRAFHDRPRAADAVGNRRGCARRRASPLELPRVVERRPGVMPPKPGPPPRQVSRGRIRRRRLGAFGGIVLAVAHRLRDREDRRARQLDAAADDDARSSSRSRSGSCSRRG